MSVSVLRKRRGDHAGHFRRIARRRPRDPELAVSADDKIGTTGHKPVAITGEAARTRVHMLRAQCDAILVGIGTVLADDPLSDLPPAGMDARSPVRVVLDRDLRIPGTSRLVHAGARNAALGGGSESPKLPRREAGGRAGAEVIRVASRIGRLDLPVVLLALADNGITRLLVEGGARVAASFVAADLVDEIWLLRGPEAIGDRGIPRCDALPLSQSPGRPPINTRASESLGKDTSHLYERAEMFTGIVTDMGEIASLTPTAQGQLRRMRIACRYDQRRSPMARRSPATASA